MMFWNWAGSVSRPWSWTESWKASGERTGGAPSVPPATWMFCWRMAATTSPAVMFRVESRSGSSQIRME